MDGYYKNDEKSKESFKHGGFATGDIGEMYPVNDIISHPPFLTITPSLRRMPHVILILIIPLIRMVLLRLWTVSRIWSSPLMENMSPSRYALSHVDLAVSIELTLYLLM